MCLVSHVLRCFADGGEQRADAVQVSRDERQLRDEDVLEVGAAVPRGGRPPQTQVRAGLPGTGIKAPVLARS